MARRGGARKAGRRDGARPPREGRCIGGRILLRLPAMSLSRASADFAAPRGLRELFAGLRARRSASTRSIPDLPRLPGGDGGGGRAVSGLLAGDPLHRAAVLRAARHALRRGSRGGAVVAAGGRRPAGVPPRARGRALRGRAGAPPRASAQIFRPRRTGARRSGRGWREPAPTSSPMRTRSFRCRCTRSGCGGGASIRRRRWRARSRFATGKPFEPQWLQRVKATRSQVGLSRAQRAQNVQGAFRAAPGAPIKGRAHRPRRRRADLRRHRQRRRAGAAARRRERGRSSRLRAGCDGRVTSHIVVEKPAAGRTERFHLAADRHLHQVELPLLPRRQGPLAPQGRAVRGNQRRRRSRRPGRDGGKGGRALDRAADLHRRRRMSAAATTSTIWRAPGGSTRCWRDER